MIIKKTLKKNRTDFGVSAVNFMKINSLGLEQGLIELKIQLTGSISFPLIHAQ